MAYMESSLCHEGCRVPLLHADMPRRSDVLMLLAFQVQGDKLLAISDFLMVRVDTLHHIWRNCSTFPQAEVHPCFVNAVHNAGHLMLKWNAFHEFKLIDNKKTLFTK